jgi:hypothetical protein
MQRENQAGLLWVPELMLSTFCSEAISEHKQG